MSEPPQVPPGGWPLYGPPPEHSPERPEPGEVAFEPPPTPSPRGSSSALVVLGVLGCLILTFCGGCIALTDVFFHAGDDFADSDERFGVPGSADNPLRITPGVAFEVSGMEYAAGWSIHADDAGDLQPRKLSVTNHRDAPVEVAVEIKLWRGSDVLAQADCSTEPIPVGDSATLDCFSADKVPKAYDFVTISDDF